MKRKDLLKLLNKNNIYLKRNGSSHDIYTDGKLKAPVPRHTEISEGTVKSILKMLNIKR